eukprot:6212737-Pleurochrysis_carterae.AAC.1
MILFRIFAVPSITTYHMLCAPRVPHPVARAGRSKDRAFVRTAARREGQRHAVSSRDLYCPGRRSPRCEL